jgi:large subunit ribosomal protein L7Ae
MTIQFKYEVTEEISEKSLEAIELTKKSGKLKKGTNEVTKVIERGVAKLVVVAQDTQPEEVIMHLPILCEEKNIPCIGVKSKTELGAAAGLGIPCSSVAITEEADAKDLIKEITSKTIGVKMEEKKD